MVTEIRPGGVGLDVRGDRHRDRARRQSFDRLTPPEEAVWIRVPTLAQLKALWQDGKLVLPRFYRPGHFLNVVV